MRNLAIGLLTFGVIICAGRAGNAQTPSAPAGTTLAAAAPAQTGASSGQSLQQWLAQPTMTGDWGGLRTQLQQAGFNITGGYIGNYAYSFAGGKRIGGDYAQQWQLGVDVDMGKVAGLTGGTFHLALNAREGRNTTADYIGNKIDVQEIFGNGQNFRLAELSYEQALFHDRVNVKGGFIVMGNDFGKTPILCDFENDAFCAHAVSLPSDSGWADYPAGKWGIRVRVNLSPDLYAETAVVQVNPGYNDHDNGFKLSLQGTMGVLFPFEVGETVALGAGGLPGHYKIGAYYDTSSAPEAGNPAVMLSGRYGGYFLADQMVWRFQPGTDRGLIVVADATISDQRTAVIPTYFVAALIAQGPFAARPHDFISLGYVRDQVNNNALGRERTLLASAGVDNPELELGENIVEVGYGIQATPWMQLHPNLQFVGNPGAFSFKHVPNAWVFGAEVKMTF